MKLIRSRKRDCVHRMPFDISRENKMREKREENLPIVRKRIPDVDAKQRRALIVVYARYALV